jgi:hypothetical protein
VEKQGEKSKPKEEIKKNIFISYKRILTSSSYEEEINGLRRENENVNVRNIEYKGQRKIDMGTADLVRINFDGMLLVKAKITGDSFLKCQQENQSILLQVDTFEIERKVRPIMKRGFIDKIFHYIGSRFIHSPKESTGMSHLRIEFDCQAILYLQLNALRDKN